MPTFGFNNESTSRGGFDIDLFDLGGGKRIRGIWKAYMADVHGCIFVVDSAAEDRIKECREVFAETLRDPHLSGKPIVVFANKQDLPTAKSAAEVAEGLGLMTLQNARHHIVPCTALRKSADEPPDTQVDLGMRWMLEQVGQDWDVLNPRVQQEGEAARLKEEELKKERIKRGEQARRERLEAEEREAAEAKAREKEAAKKAADLSNAIKKNVAVAEGFVETVPADGPASPPAKSGPDMVMAMEAPSPDVVETKRISPEGSGSPPSALPPLATSSGGFGAAAPLGSITSPREPLPDIGPRRSLGALQPLPPLNPIKNTSL